MLPEIKSGPKPYGGSQRDQGISIVETQDGGYILTGASNSSDGDFTGLNIGLYDILVLKISSSGEKQWIKNFGGIGNEGGNSIIQTLDDGYVITGLFLSNDGDFIGLNAGGDDTFILKLNSSGEKQWVKSIGGSGDEYGNAIIQTTDGGLALTGGTYSHDGDFNGLNKGLMDMFVIKFNGTGEKQWLKTFGSSSWDRGYSILQTQDGGYALTGSNNSGDGDFAGLNKGEDDIFVLKLNATGEKQWLKTYGGSDTDYPVTILQLESGSFLITGPTHSNDGDFSGLQKGDGDIFVLKVNSSSGAMLSLNTFGGSEYDKSWFLSGWKDQGYCIIGETHSNDGDFKDLKKGITDICVLKFE